VAVSAAQEVRRISMMRRIAIFVFIES
jgi:hypothetical protein